ncbi:MAG: sulfatase-like hydrolase/transferase [Promethearchaeota archaeon]
MASSREREPEDRPNVVVFLADQHRWDCLGACGNRDVRTPNLDQLAREGELFENAFCTFPVCTPSRYSLLTGLFAHQHLGLTNRSSLPAGLPTFPALLRHVGYRTAAVGKMHFTPTYADLGFQSMLLCEQDGPGRWDDDYHRYLVARGLADRVDLRDQVSEFRARAAPDYWETFGAQPSDLPDEHYSTTWIGDRAVEEAAAWETGGHLLVVGFVKPHHPFDAPPPWCDEYDPDALALPAGWTPDLSPLDASRRGFFDNSKLSETTLRRVVAQYYASITQLDHHVGRVLDALRDAGLFDDALVVYASDHGEYLGFHHLLLKGGLMYDPLVRVPLVVKWPGGRRAGRVNGDLHQLVDVAVTVLDQAGADVPQELWGVGTTLDEPGRDAVFAQAGGPNYLVRTDRLKLLVRPPPAPPLLFDLEADPLEERDVAGDPSRREDADELRGRLFSWLAFDCPARAHSDPRGPTLAAPNVPRAGDGHVERARAYFRSKMEGWPGLRTGS